MKRLVTFLGIHSYSETNYKKPGGSSFRTEYVAHAIAQLWQVDEVIVLATDEAWEKHGERLKQALDGQVQLPVELKVIPEGKTEDELWKQLEVLLDILTVEPGTELLLDITHGFRSQPFFAAGALGLLRMAGALDGVSVSVLYGRYLRDEPDHSPIWDLTLMMDLLDWAHGAAVLSATGQGGPFIEIARRSDKNIRIQLSKNGQKKFPPTHELIKAIEEFTQDLAMVRIASIITGYSQEDVDKPKVVGSAKRLLDTLEKSRKEAVDALPALDVILNRMNEVAKGLSAERLASPEGRNAMAALAKLYLQLERYPEAAIVLRETIVNDNASGPEGIEVNCAGYDQMARQAAEIQWRNNDRHAQEEVARVRNDIEHGGFNEQPKNAKVLVKDLKNLVDKYLFNEEEQYMGKTWFVTRHPGARAWAERQGFPIDHQTAHLQVEDVQSGDTVIGTLPVHLAAAVCERGARYLHLALDVPPELRGRELTADELEQCKARLEPLRVLRGC